MYGGGVYLGTGCNLVMQGGAIQNCSVSQFITGASGAALYVASGGSATLQNATFANNSAIGMAQGIVYVDGTVYAKGVVFSANAGSDYLTGMSGTWNPLP
jgi:hypothetical protein